MKYLKWISVVLGFVMLIGIHNKSQAETSIVIMDFECKSQEETMEEVKKLQLELVFTNYKSNTHRHIWVYARKDPNVYIAYIYTRRDKDKKEIWCPVSYGDGFKIFDDEYK